MRILDRKGLYTHEHRLSKNRSALTKRINCDPLTLTLPGTEHIPLRDALMVPPDSEEFRKLSQTAIQYANHKTNPDIYASNRSTRDTNRSTTIITDTMNTFTRSVLYSDSLKSNLSNNSNVTYEVPPHASQRSKYNTGYNKSNAYAEHAPSRKHKSDSRYQQTYKTYYNRHMTSPENIGRNTYHYHSFCKKVYNKDNKDNVYNNNRTDVNNFNYNDALNNNSSHIKNNNTYLNCIDFYENDNLYANDNPSNYIENNSYIRKNHQNNNYVKNKNDIEILPKPYQAKNNLFRSPPRKTIKIPLLKTPLCKYCLPTLYSQTIQIPIQISHQNNYNTNNYMNNKQSKYKPNFKENIHLNKDINKNINYSNDYSNSYYSYSKPEFIKNTTNYNRSAYKNRTNTYNNISK